MSQSIHLFYHFGGNNRKPIKDSSKVQPVNPLIHETPHTSSEGAWMACVDTTSHEPYSEDISFPVEVAIDVNPTKNTRSAVFRKEHVLRQEVVAPTFDHGDQDYQDR